MIHDFFFSVECFWRLKSTTDMTHSISQLRLAAKALLLLQ
jgi:hypothetical protein